MRGIGCDPWRADDLSGGKSASNAEGSATGVLLTTAHDFLTPSTIGGIVCFGAAVRICITRNRRAPRKLARGNGDAHNQHDSGAHTDALMATASVSDEASMKANTVEDVVSGIADRQGTTPGARGT